MKKYGRRAPYRSAEKPRVYIDDYLNRTSLPTPPATIDRTVPSWAIFLNDALGDCTIAAPGHEIQAWTYHASNRTKEVTLPDSAILTAYEAVSGYDPLTGANDNGAVEQDVLAYWTKTGIGGHKIVAYAQLRDMSAANLALGVYLFGSVYAGLNLPQSAETQFDGGRPWTVVKGSPIAGGHAVPIQRVDPSYLYVVSWARLQKMARPFWSTYGEEAWVVITRDWLQRNGDTVDGINLAGLGADIAALTGGPDPIKSALS